MGSPCATRCLLEGSHVGRNCLGHILLCSFTDWEQLGEVWCVSAVGPKAWQKEVVHHLRPLQQGLLKGAQALQQGHLGELKAEPRVKGAVWCGATVLGLKSGSIICELWISTYASEQGFSLLGSAVTNSHQAGWLCWWNEFVIWKFQETIFVSCWSSLIPPLSFSILYIFLICLPPH